MLHTQKSKLYSKVLSNGGKKNVYVLHSCSIAKKIGKYKRRKDRVEAETVAKHMLIKSFMGHII